MRTKGYIKLPRAIQAESWYRKPACRLVALHLLLEASYRDEADEDLGVVEVGTLRSSVRQLAIEVGISVQSLRTALDTLKASGFVEVKAIENGGRADGLTMVVRWDKYTSLRDDNIMLNNSRTNSRTNTRSAFVTAENSGNYSDEKKLLTHGLTHGLTHNKEEIINNTHTGYYNPGKILKAGAREAQAYTREVHELEQWIALYTPDFLAMEIPLSPKRMAEMISTYPMPDIQRLLATAWSKGACSRHRSAWQAFKSFARNDRELKATTGEKLYTYAEMCDYVARYGVRQEDAFSIVPQPNGEKPKWRRNA